MRNGLLFVPLLFSMSQLHCGSGESTKGLRFGDEVDFLKEYMDVIVLQSDENQDLVAVVPELQGRVMTSTMSGTGGLSLGWVNRAHIASKKTLKHFNPYGGEDRFWLGPEGGQFSIFFRKGASFDLEHWFTPPAIDTEPFDVVSKKTDLVLMKKSMHLTNYSGTVFDLEVAREVRVIADDLVPELLGTTAVDGIDAVVYQSKNRITNTGKQAWRKETGLLSIWILGMFNHSPGTTILVPYVEGNNEELGPVVNDTYFGKVPPDRLQAAAGLIYFKADGQMRTKIGLTPQRAKSLLGSYDAVNAILTVVQYHKPDDIIDYVNSMWEIQAEPFAGDVVNAYNDGPPEPGAKPMGPFYELETSSPAAALDVGESLSHMHRTFHFHGTEEKLDGLARAVFGVGIAQITGALP
jgi:hypothetical protein